jgi:hypothetical protein
MKIIWTIENTRRLKFGGDCLPLSRHRLRKPVNRKSKAERRERCYACRSGCVNLPQGFRRGLNILCRLVTNFERFDLVVWRKVIKILSCS